MKDLIDLYKKTSNIMRKQSKSDIKKMIEDERYKLRADKHRAEQMQEYWEKMLDDKYKSNRYYARVYDQLYEYGKVNIEN